MEWPITVSDDKAEYDFFKSFSPIWIAEWEERAKALEARGWRCAINSSEPTPFARFVYWKWANIPAIYNTYYRERRYDSGHE